MTSRESLYGLKSTSLKIDPTTTLGSDLQLRQKTKLYISFSIIMLCPSLDGPPLIPTATASSTNEQQDPGTWPISSMLSD
uniref:Uncharacterized protein n=1 Tax=Fusarium oxysporum (strain Fo5176) TaxID=660025 RepID=A0A0D2XG15_FUSOF